jgi:hypothetical protein
MVGFAGWGGDPYGRIELSMLSAKMSTSALSRSANKDHDHDEGEHEKTRSNEVRQVAAFRLSHKMIVGSLIGRATKLAC